jgi:hypothetical protein
MDRVRAMLDFSTFDVIESEPCRRINAAIDAAIELRRSEEPRRDYLGASSLGDPCDRRLVYETRGEPASDPVSARALRIFETGHMFEQLVRKWLIYAGFDILDLDPNTGRPCEFEIADGRIRGHADGVIMRGPEIGVPYPVVWECKSLNDAAWSDLAKRGLKQAKPIYWAQCQTYLLHLGYTNVMLSAVNKNNALLYHEIIEIAEAEANRLSERAVRIVEMVEVGGVPSRIEDTQQCRWCSYLHPCQNES